MGVDVKSLGGAEGFARLPGLGSNWNHILNAVDKTWKDQDDGLVDPGGKVEATIKVVFSRQSLGSTEMQVTQSCSLKLPGYNAKGATAHKDGSDWLVMHDTAEQQQLFPPGVTEIKPRGGSNTN